MFSLVGFNVKNSIIIVDYGAGNLKSIKNAFEYLGYKPFITKTQKTYY